MFQATGLVVVFALVVDACPPKPPSIPDKPAKLIATFFAPHPGQVSIYVDDSIITVNGTVSGLPPNAKLGVHIHENGDLGNRCLNAKGHYNPLGEPHGGPTDDVRHPGDFGNVDTDSKGVMNFDLKIIPHGMPRNDAFLGLAMVIHNGTDDLGKGGDVGSMLTGNSGARITCAVLGRAEKEY